MRNLTRVRARLRRARPLTQSERWAAYLTAVEPELMRVPRVHRFAQSPVLGAADGEPKGLAVWIEGEFESEAMRRSLDSLHGSSALATGLLRGPLDQALAETRAERVLLVSAGDQLAPLALERLGQAAALAPEATVLTCDEDRLGADGERLPGCFRPCPSPDRWLACDDTSRTLVVRREAAARALKEVRSEHAWRHELALRLAGPRGQEAAHVPLLLAHRGSGARSPDPVEPAAVEAVLRTWEGAGRVEAHGHIRRVRRDVRSEPSVEVIVCLRDEAALLRRCVDSLLGLTDYDHLKLCLVDNGSREPETLELLTRYAEREAVRVLRDPRPFNFAALNNGAAQSSSAQVLVFLNNDTEVVEAGWVEPLLEQALRPEVGAVAPMLLYPDGTVQHAGAALGLHGYAGHPFAGLAPDARTPFGRADGGARNWLAVTAACMMLERSKFNRVGGFDEQFVVAGNDVDLCLRLTSAGHRSLCVPQIPLIHDESRSRGSHIDPADFVLSEQRYGEFRTVGDPFYNPNLTLDATDCSVRVSPASA
jgi:GT2 family glycosyltransferase